MSAFAYVHVLADVSVLALSSLLRPRPTSAFQLAGHAKGLA